VRKIKVRNEVIGSVEVGKTDLNHLWDQFDRNNPNPRERIYSIAQIVGCVPECPCRIYDQKIGHPSKEISNYCWDFKENGGCKFYAVNKCGEYDLHKGYELMHTCRLDEVIHNLDLVLREGPKIPLKKEVLR
jgi:hypothetical protein